MLDEFAKAFTAQPVTVLGVRLRPFSFGHAYILEAGKNPIVASGAPVSLEDFCVAVQICSRTFREGIAFVSGGQIDGAENWAKEIAGMNLADELARFTAYVRDYHTAPRRWKTGKESVTRAPWMLQHVAGLLGDAPMIGQALDDAMNTPICEGVAMNAARNAWHGDESLVSEDEVSGMEMLKRLNAEKDSDVTAS